MNGKFVKKYSRVAQVNSIDFDSFPPSNLVIKPRAKRMKDTSLCVREKKMEKLSKTATWPGKKNEMILQSLKNNDG